MSKIISAIESIIKKQMSEGKFGAFDIQNVSEFGQKYKKFIDDTMKANNFGKYIGYCMTKGTLTIIGESGLIDFDINNMKPVRTAKIWK